MSKQNQENESIETRAAAAGPILNEQKLLPLAAQRAIHLTFQGEAYVFQFGAISNADWKEYFDSVYIETRTTPEGRERVYDDTSAAFALTRKRCLGVTNRGGEVKLLSIPPRLLVAAFSVLLEVAPELVEKGREIIPSSDSVEVRLAAIWGSTEDGKNTAYLGLKHFFRFPELRDVQKYNRAAARTVVNSREGVTRTIPAQSAMIALYDDMIQGVDGYQVEGRAITGPEGAKSWMDGAHKVVAVTEVFAPAGEVAVG